MKTYLLTDLGENDALEGSAILRRGARAIVLAESRPTVGKVTHTVDGNVLPLVRRHLKATDTEDLYIEAELRRPSEPEKKKAVQDWLEVSKALKEVQKELSKLRERRNRTARELLRTFGQRGFSWNNNRYYIGRRRGGSYAVTRRAKRHVGAGGLLFENGGGGGEK